MPGFFQELSSRVFLPGFLRFWSDKIQIDQLPIPKEAIKKGRPVDVVLSPKLLLRKNMTFPKAARKELRHVIEVAARQSLPNGGKSLVWTYEIEAKVADKIPVSIYVAKQSLLTQIEHSISKLEAIVRTIDIADQRTNVPLVDNRLRVDRPRLLWGMLNLFLIGLVLALLVWAEVRENTQLRQNLSELAIEKAELQSKAVLLRETAKTQSSVRDKIDKDIERFLLDHSRLTVLLGLTKIFDDETWISEFEANGRTLKLSGFTAHDVPNIIDTLRAAEWSSAVELDGPVSFDTASRTNRFNLVVELR